MRNKSINIIHQLVCFKTLFSDHYMYITTGIIPKLNLACSKFSYSRGTYIRFGGDYQNLQLAWQYSWLGRPR